MSHNRRAVMILLLVSVYLLSFAMHFSPFAEVKTTEETGDRLYSYYTYVDVTGQLSFDEISSENYEHQFISQENHLFKFGVSNHANWMKLKVNHMVAEEGADDYRLLMSYAVFSDIHIYVPTNEGDKSYAKLVGGIEQGPERNDGSFVFPIFELPANIDAEREVYIRIQGPTSANFELVLRTAEETSQLTHRIILFLGLASGIILSMILYNLALYFVLHDRVYLWYVTYMTLTILYQSGIVGTLRIVDLQLGDFVVGNAVLFSMFALIGHLVFAWHFLNIKESAPGMVKSIYACVVICSMGILMIIMGNPLAANFIAFSVSLVMLVILLVTVYISYQNKNWVSKYYIMAMAVLFISTFVFFMRGFGIIEPTFITSYYVIAAAALESILYSFALAERIRSLRLQNFVLQEKEKELFELSITDQMTGLFNRRYFEQVLEVVFCTDNNESGRACLLMMDIDNFKQVNDTYGHRKGDEIIKELGEIALRNIRSIDYAFRVGGEEFAILLREAKLENAYEVAERIRLELARNTFVIDNQKSIHVTISIGAAEFNGCETGLDLFGRADSLLYKAKRAGKNRTEIQEETEML